MDTSPVVIIGAGPSGLTAANELVKGGVSPTVLEQGDKVGGLARTEEYKGYRFDLGGHRFFTKVEEIRKLWEEMLGDDVRTVPRQSRIYHDGQFFDYPLHFFETMSKLGLAESARILGSYFRARLRPSFPEDTFEQWVTNRFGRRLYETFFEAYTEKLWGIPCDQIQADWAMQRIRGLSLTAAISNALFGTDGSKSLIKEFYYPVRGPGMMWERFADAVQTGGGRVRLNAEVLRLNRDGGRIRTLTVRSGGETGEVAAEQVISSMPLTSLAARIDPPSPPDVAQAAAALSHRAFVLVGLILDRAELFSDNWIYVNSPEVKVGRIQNFKNWSPAMVPDPSKTALGMEYFCGEGDEIWSASDAELSDLASRELAALGLAEREDVIDSLVLRQKEAYPVYDIGYREALQVVRRFVGSFENLQTIGRGGMHRYNNQDHSMLTGILAARNLLGESHDLWEVNGDESYHEAGR